jgi:hypothetical protein
VLVYATNQKTLVPVPDWLYPLVVVDEDGRKGKSQRRQPLGKRSAAAHTQLLWKLPKVSKLRHILP